MLDNISIKAMTAYEKATKGNAFDLFKKEDKTATDLVWLLWMMKYTKDNTVTFDAIENMSADEFAKAMNALNEPATPAAPAA